LRFILPCPENATTHRFPYEYRTLEVAYSRREQRLGAVPIQKPYNFRFSPVFIFVM